MYDVTIGNDSASLGSERTDIMNTKGKKPKRKVKMDYGDGSIYFVKSRNCYAGQVYLEIDGRKNPQERLRCIDTSCYDSRDHVYRR